MKTIFLIFVIIMVATMAQAEAEKFFKKAEHNHPLTVDEKKINHDSKKNSNRLVHSNSPYLLQHANQPVDWYPWSEEAFKKARDENKPVFLSIGYSTCHWCHVMAHESFDDPHIASILNKDFVAIKVDREERPDIDDYYMIATQLFTGRGGWPNSLWLTSNKKPWFCGTYFPKEDRPGMAGFETLLLKQADVWRAQNKTVLTQADQIHDAIEALQKRSSVQEQFKKEEDFFGKLLHHYEVTFDSSQGGFSYAPKFPPHQQLENLFYSVNQTQNESHKKMIKQTLDAMANGSIRDHIGGGFHRYTTDYQWRVPHFEKMLYDNALLIRAYSKGYQLFKEKVYCEIVDEAIGWLIREMQSKSGGFYSALDADSEGEEGRYYIWEYNQIKSILSIDNSALFMEHYNIKESGNYKDEIKQEKNGNNIIYQTNSETIEQVKRMKQAVLEKRNERIRPHLDDKIITAWNSLLISSLVEASKTFDRLEWLLLAEETGKALAEKVVKKGVVHRSYRKGVATIKGFLNDYAFLGNSFLDLYFATKKDKWLKKAIKIGIKMEIKFRDSNVGGFFLAENAVADLPIRSKDPYDNVLPSGNSMALRLLLRLQQLKPELLQESNINNTVRWLEQQLAITQTGLDSAALVVQRYKKGRENKKQESIIDSFPLESIVMNIIPLNRNENTWLFNMTFDIKTDWHINSAKPLENYLLPFRVELENDKEGKIVEISYPKGSDIKTNFGSGKISIFTNTIKITGKVKVYHQKNISKKPLFLKVFYQACNDQQCMEPKTLKIGPGKHDIQSL